MRRHENTAASCFTGYRRALLIHSNIIPPLLNVLQHGDFRTKKEACWAISNATSGGLQEPAQIRYLVTQGCIKPMCDLLKTMDNKIIQVALDGLENILKVGEMDKDAEGPGATNQYAQYVEEAGGMHHIFNLQNHENLEIYKKCFYIMDSECSSYWLELCDGLRWGHPGGFKEGRKWTMLVVAVVASVISEARWTCVLNVLAGCDLLR